MTYDPNNLNDPARPLDPYLDLRTTPVSRRRSGSWFGWVVAIAVIAVAAFAYTQWPASNTDPQTTASTTNAEPAPIPAKPMAPADNNMTPVPAPATPPAAPDQQ